MFKLEDDPRYLKTFDPEIVKLYKKSTAYKHGGRRKRKKKKFGKKTGIDQWLKTIGIKMLEKRGIGYLSDIVTLELRSFWDSNGNGRVFQLKNLERKTWKGLLEQIKATDITTIGGSTIIGMDRKQISLNGPEFYVIMKNPHTQLGIPGRYLSGKWKIMKKYYDLVMNSLMENVSSTLVNFRTPGEVSGFVKNIKPFIRSVITDCINKTHVPDEYNPEGYNSKTVLNLFVNSDVGMVKSVKLFKPDLIDSCCKNYGRTFIEWFKVFGKEWEQFQSSKSNMPLSEEEEKGMIKSSLSKKFSSRYYDGFKDFILVCNGSTIGVKAIGANFSKKLVVNERARLFSNFDHQYRCPECDSIECERMKFSRRKGIMGKVSNPTSVCPKSLFDSKMNKDTKFATYITMSMFKRDSLKKKEKKKKIPIGSSAVPGLVNQKVTILNIGQTFDKGKHVLNRKPIKTRLIGNKISKGQGIIAEKSNLYTEYQYPGMDGELFLIETSVESSVNENMGIFEPSQNFIGKRNVKPIGGILTVNQMSYVTNIAYDYFFVTRRFIYATNADTDLIHYYNSSQGNFTGFLVSILSSTQGSVFMSEISVLYSQISSVVKTQRRKKLMKVFPEGITGTGGKNLLLLVAFNAAELKILG